MTIDEAISHAKEVAAIQRSNEKLNRTLGSASPYINETCLECAEEHEQLAEWLEELKELRELKSKLNINSSSSIFIVACSIFSNIPSFIFG